VNDCLDNREWQIVKWDEQLRFRLIETIAMWEGCVNSSHLRQYFGIGRQQASKEIKAYLQSAPENLEYNASIKGYSPCIGFAPKFTQGRLDEYQYLVGQGLETNLSEIATGFDALQLPIRNLSPQLVQPILKACREHLRLDIGYLSLSSPDYQDRIISPHTLVYDGLRWHVRAWCEKNQAYRDFVLSRFRGDYAFEGNAEYTADQDELWQARVDVIIQPDPRLSEAQKRIIELDYAMENGQRCLSTRAALVTYLLQRLRIDLYQTTAEAQQIILTPESRKEVVQYLPQPV
jgi:predicted DNA-binding transcriptional regulator YafY